MGRSFYLPKSRIKKLTLCTVPKACPERVEGFERFNAVLQRNVATAPRRRLRDVLRKVN
jgi:hypothetical protein